MKEIEIGIACNNNSHPYIRNLINSIEETKSDKYKIKFILGLNKPINVNKIIDEYPNFNFKLVECYTSGIGSKDHGKCIDLIFKEMSSEYGVITDCDVALLEKNWDELLINQLNDKNIIIGSEYRCDKYLNFPNVIFCLFNIEKMKKINVNFKAPLTHITIDESNKNIFGREVGDRIFLDTAGYLPRYVKESGYNGIPLRMVKENEKESVFMIPGLRGEEFQLNGVPICTHIGRSSERDFNSNKIISKWLGRISSYRKENGMKKITNILQNTTHKNDYKSTTTYKFKKDLIRVLLNKNFNGNILEVGSNCGHTSVVLAAVAEYLKKKFFAYEYNSNLIKKSVQLSKQLNVASTFIQKDVYKEDWNDVENIGFVFIDCVHTEKCFTKDLENAFSLVGPKGLVVAHDYGLETLSGDRIKNVLENNPNYKITQYLGEEKDWNKNGSGKAIDWEGVLIEKKLK